MAHQIPIDARTLDVLEWGDIQNEICSRAQTSMGSTLALKWAPGELSSEEAFKRSRAILQILELKNESQLKLPLLDFPDITQLMKRISRSGAISVEEFADLVRFHKGVQSFIQFLTRYCTKKNFLVEELTGLDSLEDWSRRHFPLLDNQGGIADTASEDLRALRKLSRDLKEKIQRKLEDFLQNPKLSELMQDFYITVRDGRYVLPIKNNFKGRVPGIIHDVSNTEQTFFVEPQEVVDLNNQLKVVDKEIEIEIERILAEIVSRTAPVVGEFKKNQDKIVAADLLNAASLLVESWGGIDVSAVEWGEYPHFEKIRHPILSLHSQVVPNSLDLKRSLILSGPNTGGKTVLLKTLGLGYCLAWAGMPVPAKKIQLPQNFHRLFSDIGDDQDLGQNLSTFSGHLNVLKKIYETAEEGDLIFIDEIATGTSPEEGQPLAQAFIEKMLEKNCKLLVTTHYGALKHFAMTDERLRIGAMAFDSKTRRPTFELRLDIPGESSALETAEQLGLSKAIVERARQLRGEVSEDVSLALSRLEKTIENMRSKESEVEELKTQLEQEKERLKKRQQEYESLQRKGLSEESKQIVKSLMQLRDELSQAVRQASGDDLKSGSMSLFTKISDAADKIRSFSQETDRGESPLQSIADEELVLDALVEVEGVGLGTLIEIPKGPPFDAKAQFSVQVGELKTRVARSRLRKPTRERSSQFLATKAAVAASREKKAVTVNLESSPKAGALSGSVVCDVRGKTRDEAMRKVDIALNELLKGDHVTVTIIHGHGTDRLKESIREYLDRRREDVQFRGGTWPGEGGEGVTVVERSY